MNNFEQMVEQTVDQLEKAVQIILAPPNLVTTQQRHSADEVFLNFRKTKCPYQLCQQILETSTNDYILFEAAGLLKLALIREWSNLSKQDICSLKQYLLHYIINKPHLTTYVRGNILQVIAIIIEKGRMNDSGKEQQEFLNEIQNLIITGDLPKKILGCNLISALLEEYKLHDKSSPNYFLLKTASNERKEFINVTLKRILKFSLEIFDELIKKDLLEDTLVLLKHLLPIVESILTWQLDYNFQIEIVQNLNESWQDIILPPGVLDLFFTLYWKIRGNPQIAHLARSCLMQLAGIDGPIFSSKEIKTQYFSNYTRKFLEFITNIDVIDQEASGIADIISRLTRLVYTNTVSFPEDILKALLEQMCRLICLYIENSAQEEFLCASECSYSEGLDVLFATWIHITSRNTPDEGQKPNLISDEFCRQISIQIFNVYLQCHLCPPDGIRNLETKELNQKEDDTEEDDTVRFKEQLQAIGYCGRQALNHSLSLLSHLIGDRTSKLHENFNNLVRHTESLNALNNTYMIRLYEDIHWLLLISGHVLCMESTGEIALIPTEIIKYSMEQANQGKINVDLTLQLLAASENVLSDMNIATELVDHVIHFVTNIFRLCAIEKTAISVGLDSVLSPVLSCTILWFLQRWSFSYLLPRENDYSEISPTFLEVFGEDSHGAFWAINFLLDKIECNINSFRSEPTIMRETIQLLISLVTSQSKAISILKSERFKSIWNLAVKERYDFSSEVKRGLMQAVIQCEVVDLNSAEEQDNYYSQILQPLKDRYMQIISDEKFLKSYHQEKIKVQLMDIFDRLIGVAQGCEHIHLTSETLIIHVYPILERLPQLLSLYHNYQEIVQLILELLCKYSKPLMFISLPKFQTETSQIDEICLNAMQKYVCCNSNRFTKDLNSEESYQDIVLLMKLLNNLIPADAFLRGFNIIIPIINTDLLRFPSLCSYYYKILSTFCTKFPEKACNLSPELLRSILVSVEWGLFSSEQHTFKLCCDVISSLANHINLHTSNECPRNQMLLPFLNLLMTAFLAGQINTDLIDEASRSLYHLIICYSEEYKQLVQNILSIQMDQRVIQKLEHVFTKLTTTVNNLKEFNANVRLLLTLGVLTIQRSHGPP